MNSSFKLAAIAVLAAAFAAPAMADQAETKGGITIKTDDGRFETKIGGRIHFDGNLILPDDDSVFNSGALDAAGANKSGFYLRRIYLTVAGKAYGWKYKIEPDFCGAGGVSNSDATKPATEISNTCRELAFQDVYLGTDLGPGEVLLGQRKAYRGMEELTSSNELTMIERPFVSAGLVGGRDFQQGVFYSIPGNGYTASAAVYSLHGTTSDATQGTGLNTRLTYAPILSERDNLHIGASYSADNLRNGSKPSAKGRYYGRLGDNQSLVSDAPWESVNTWTGELAGNFGPFFAQAEYMSEDFDDAPGKKSQTVDGWYVQTSVFLTGEAKPYKAKDGVYGNPKPTGAMGAWEVAVRYEQAKNDDLTTSTDVEKLNDLTLGLNWYVNPNARFMLNYVMGKAERVDGQEDKPDTIAARAQFSF